MRKNGIKNTRINGEVKKELSILISREIKDPRINPMTSVLDVQVAPDLKTAKVYISVMGDEESKKETHEGLKRAASYMRSQLARRLNLRNTPELTFIIDSSIEYGVNMSKLIDEVNSKSTFNADDVVYDVVDDDEVDDEDDDEEDEDEDNDEDDDDEDDEDDDEDDDDEDDDDDDDEDNDED